MNQQGTLATGLGLVAVVIAIIVVRTGFFAGKDILERDWNADDGADPQLVAGFDALDDDDHDKAIACFSDVISRDATNIDAYVGRGEAYDSKRDYGKAVADFTKAIQLDEENPDIHNFLAWLLATCPQEQWRDGKKALEHAKRACELTGHEEGNLLDTLAAAYAECGRFDDAVKWQKRALDKRLDFDAAEYEKAKARLPLYRAKKPFRDEK